MDPQNNQSQSQPSGQGGGQSTGQNNTTPGASSTGNHTVLAALSYIGPLVIVSYLMGKDNEFVKFHVKQGLVVFVIEVIIYILGSMMFSFYMLLNVLNLGTLILSIIGIVNVVQGNKKDLPLVGGFAKSFNI